MARDIRSLARCIGLVLAALMLASTVSCAPAGAAVGDDRAGDSSVQSSGVERGDVSIGLVGSYTASADDLVLDAYDSAGLKASYVSLRDTARPVAGAQQAVRDLLSRQVTVIAISGIDASQDKQGWAAALQSARHAGIPVMLINPIRTPADTRLFAAALTINDRATDAVPIDKATMLVVNDRPHARNMMVTTLKH